MGSGAQVCLSPPWGSWAAGIPKCFRTGPLGQVHQKQRCCSTSSSRARVGGLPSWAHRLPPPSGERLLLPSLVRLMNQQEPARETPALNQGCWLNHLSHDRNGGWLDHLTNALAWVMHLLSQRYGLQTGASAALTTLPVPSPTQPHPHTKAAPTNPRTTPHFPPPAWAELQMPHPRVGSHRHLEPNVSLNDLIVSPNLLLLLGSLAIKGTMCSRLPFPYA